MSRLGLNRIRSLDHSNNPKPRLVYSYMIIVDKLHNLNDMKCKDMKVNCWKVNCKNVKNKETKCKNVKVQKNKEQKLKNNKNLDFTI